MHKDDLYSHLKSSTVVYNEIQRTDGIFSPPPFGNTLTFSADIEHFQAWYVSCY